MADELICRKHKPTPRDLAEIADFKRYLQIVNEGQDVYHLSQRKAHEYAAMEIYGDVFAEGSRRDDEEG